MKVDRGDVALTSTLGLGEAISDGLRGGFQG